MYIRFQRICAVGALVFALCLLGAVVAARQAPPPAPPLAGEVFTNVQILQGIPVDEFMGTMGFFSASTGLNCTDCHVEEAGGNWARYADDNEIKQTTRRMMLMVDAINRANFGGRQVVTCTTCHRGVSQPAVMPSIDTLYGEPPPDEPGNPFVEFPGQPSVDEVLDRYIEALGGAQSVAGLTSLVARGTHMGFDDAVPAPMEIYAQAADRRAIVVEGLLGMTTTVFDGTSGWITAPLTDRPIAFYPLSGQELEGMRLEAVMFFPGGIRDALTNWRVGVPVLLDDREARPIQGDIPGGGVGTLTFDDETGLLTRLVRFTESPVGPLVTRVEYEDYREVAGVQIPFRWTVSWLSGRSVYELTDVQPNVPIDPARFARPPQ